MSESNTIPVPGSRVTRLAPSPTGALHLGNARTFLVNWALARQFGWRIVCRIEDFDTPRIKSGAIAECLDILHWLGIEWDDEPLIQSHDIQPYRKALDRLAGDRAIYRCELTRSQIKAAASAPHAGEHELAYPAHLRPSDAADDRWQVTSDDQANYRFVVPERTIVVHDNVMGDSPQRPCDQTGDFVIWTKQGLPAYQLAVVVDDIRQGVTDVVRGADLLPSAARQTLIYQALGASPPSWWHLPLVAGEDGRRLAKRHGDTRISFYRENGVAAERLIGLLAWWSGVGGEPNPMSANEFASRFKLPSLPREEVVFREVDHQWLL